MDKVFSGLKNLIKLDKIVIDNHVFRLHYKVTVALLIACSILVTSRQYFGDPIDCISKDSVPSRILDTFCWIHSTFSVKEAWNKKVGVQVPYPGVDKYTPGEERVYHAYYQWVCFVLFLQAILFYIPRYIWKAMEGNKVNSLVLDLSSPIIESEKKQKSCELLCHYFKENLGHHRLYFYGYILCECLNFVNVIGQIYLMDEFLGGEFSTYGTKVLSFTEWDWSVRFDPMIKVFPRLTKCTFHMYGSSGDVQKYDAMCILPINIINEKIYVFLWFWFVILSFVSGLMLVYRALIVLYPPMRIQMIVGRARLANTKTIRDILDHCDIGEWFLLDLLSKNLDSVNYKEFVDELKLCLEKRKKNMDCLDNGV